MSQHPNIDTPYPPPYNENEGMNRKSKLVEQERQQSGDLPESSDPVREEGDKPFRITYPGR